MTHTPHRATTALLLALALPACGARAAAPSTVQPGAPGQATRAVEPGAAPSRVPLLHSPADVRFMKGMIPHHAQAVVMTALVEARTTRPDVRAVAKRIELSQNDEMALMK